MGARAVSLLEREAAEIPGLLARQARQLPAQLESALTRIDRMAPRLMVTVARGSSGNAADYVRYVAMLCLGLPASAVPPSVASVYGRTLRMEGAVALAISQSGESPDLAASARALRAAGALTLGLVNEPGSTLSREVDVEITIGAGAERAVPSTKTFMLSVTAGLHLVALWSRDARLQAALAALPSAFECCHETDRARALDVLAAHPRAFVVGRGPALAVAQEMALKLGEAAGLPADAQSAATLLHGPIALASGDVPAIVLAGDSHGRESVQEAVSRLRAAGAPVLLIAPETHATDGGAMPVPDAGHELLQPLVSLYALYPAIAAVAHARGRDPDRPPHLRKTTLTR